MRSKSRQRSLRSSGALGLESLETRCMLSGQGNATGMPDLREDGLLAGVSAKPGGGGGSTSRDDYGNTFAAAASLSLSSTGAGTISGKIEATTDVDMFKLAAPVAGSLSVSITTSAGKKVLTPHVILYAGNQTKITENANVGGSKTATVSTDVTAGQTYYLSMAGYTAVTGNYSIQVTTVQPPPPVVIPGPNDYAPAAIVSGAAYGSLLVIQGTTANDQIMLSQSGDVITVVANGATQTFTGPFTVVAVYGFDGADALKETASLSGSLTTVLYGGVGSDSLYEACPDQAYLYGEDGDDSMVSVGGGADSVTGGAGLDTFWTDSSDKLADVETAETAARSVHSIASFAQSVSLEVAGQEIADPVAGYSYSDLFVNQPLFAAGPEYNDIKQGALGDCYFLAGLSAIAQSDPALIRQSITALGDGTYAIRFFKSGVANYYRVDAQLPTSGSSPAYAKLTRYGSELWVALLEKAFAQFRYGQNSYASIEGGWMDEAYTAITGLGYSSYSTSAYTADALAQKMQNDLLAGHALTAASAGDIAPIVGGHAYEIHAVEYDTTTGTWYVTVYNPWGVDGNAWDSNSSDGLLRLTAADFKARFSYLEVASA